TGPQASVRRHSSACVGRKRSGVGGAGSREDCQGATHPRRTRGIAVAGVVVYPQTKSLLFGICFYRVHVGGGAPWIENVVGHWLSNSRSWRIDQQNSELSPKRLRSEHGKSVPPRAD